jgi:hypothetical protein
VVMPELDQVLGFFTESLGGKKVNRPGFSEPPDFEGFLSGPTEMAQLWNSRQHLAAFVNFRPTCRLRRPHAAPSAELGARPYSGRLSRMPGW